MKNVFSEISHQLRISQLMVFHNNEADGLYPIFFVNEGNGSAEFLSFSFMSMWEKFKQIYNICSIITIHFYW